MPHPAAMTAVNLHQSAVPTDPNNAIRLTGVDVGPGGAPTGYLAEYAGGQGGQRLTFQTEHQTGLTNEALLAVVYDRLMAFQAGPYPCPENEKAATSILAAVMHLKKRTERRHAAGLEGKMAEDVPAKAEKARVRLEGDTLIVGSRGFQPAALAQWKTWAEVESALRQAAPDPTAAEMELVEKAAAHLGGAARNGLAELKSALASTRKPG